MFSLCVSQHLGISNDLTLTQGNLVEVKLLHFHLLNLDLPRTSKNKLQHDYFQRVPKAVINMNTCTSIVQHINYLHPN